MMLDRLRNSYSRGTLFLFLWEMNICDQMSTPTYHHMSSRRHFASVYGIHVTIADQSDASA